MPQQKGIIVRMACNQQQFILSNFFPKSFSPLVGKRDT